MATSTDKRRLTGEPVSDWFVPAITCDGSVDQCLSEVERSLGYQRDFIAALKSALRGPQGQSVDSITAINNEQKLLANSLRFRLGMLNPDRPGAWFRPPVSTTMGPFSSAMLREPVFGPFDLNQSGKVQARLERAFEEGQDEDLPFEEDGPCLWRTLLQLNARLERACQLPAPFQNLRLDSLPDGLPGPLASYALQAFLKNVRGEIIAVRERIRKSYDELLGASKKFWQAARLRPAERRRGFQTQDADDVREAFRRRRRNRTPVNTFGMDQEALRFMGFDSVPSNDELRKRYLDLAKKFHPDRCGGDDSQFKILTKSYQALSRMAR